MLEEHFIPWSRGLELLVQLDEKLTKIMQKQLQLLGRMLKAPPVNPRAKAFSVLKFNCWNCNAIVGAIVQIPKFATLGVLFL